PQHVDAPARAGRGEPGIRVLDPVPAGRPPFEEGVLDRILGVGARAEDAVGQAHEPGPGPFEDGDVARVRHPDLRRPRSSFPWPTRRWRSGSPAAPRAGARPPRYRPRTT